MIRFFVWQTGRTRKRAEACLRKLPLDPRDLILGGSNEGLAVRHNSGGRCPRGDEALVGIATESTIRIHGGADSRDAAETRRRGRLTPE